MFTAFLVVLSVVLIPLIVWTGSGHQNSEIYQAIKIGVLQQHLARGGRKEREGERKERTEGENARPGPYFAGSPRLTPAAISGDFKCHELPSFRSLFLWSDHQNGNSRPPMDSGRRNLWDRTSPTLIGHNLKKAIIGRSRSLGEIFTLFRFPKFKNNFMIIINTNWT